jgi:hypothetical protein
MFFYLHCGRGFNCLHRRREKRCLISCFLCGNPQNNFGPHKAPRDTFDTFEHHHSHHAPCWTHATSTFHGIMPRPLFIVMHVQSCNVSIWFWDNKRAHFTCETTCCIEENCSAATGVEQQNLDWEKSELLQNTWWKFSFSYLRTITQMPVSKPEGFMT